MTSGIERVRKYFSQYGIEERIREFDVSSATVDLAAKAVGVDGARICKTISLKSRDGCTIIQMAGDARIDNRKYKARFGEKARFLSPDEVVEYTGYEIGGVCAFAIDRSDVWVYCDESLRRFDTVFPACGTPNSAIELTCSEIFRYSGAVEWVDVTRL